MTQPIPTSSLVRSVPTSAALSLIRTEQIGALGYVQATRSYYAHRQGTDVPNGATILASAVTGYRWYLVLGDNADEIDADATAWFVDPAGTSGGSDSNSGKTALTPLLTLGELGRRISGQLLVRNLIVVTLLSNQTDAADILQVYADPQPNGNAPSQAGAEAGKFWILGGIENTATFQDPNTLSVTALTLTANATAPNFAAAPAGESALLTVAGFDWTPHIGLMVRVVTSATAANAYAVILAAPALGVARICPINSPTTPSAGIPGETTILAAASYPVLGDTVTIYRPTDWTTHVSVGALRNYNVVFQNLNFTATTGQALGPGSVSRWSFLGCRLQREIALLGQTNGGYFTASLTIGGSALVFAAPPAGRVGTKWKFHSGSNFLVGCGVLNATLSVGRNAELNFSSCTLQNSQWQLTGYGVPPCAGVASSNSGGSQFSAQVMGLGIFNWNAANDLLPAPATTRGTSGGAIELRKGSTLNLWTPLYGNSANANTNGVLVSEGSKLIVNQILTSSAAPPPPVAPDPAQTANSLRILGAVSNLLVEGETDHIPFVTHKGVLTGAIAPAAGNYIPLTTWVAWEDAPTFNRNAVGLKTGAAVLTFQQ